MLGFAEFWAFMGYLCMILSALLCVVYGLVNWNNPKIIDQEKEIEEEIKWEKKDSEAIK
jgi:hypothetical protein